MSIGRVTLAQYWQHVRKFKTSFWLMFFIIPFSNVLITSALPYFFSQTIGALTGKNFDSAQHFFLLSAIAGILGVVMNFVGFYAMVYHESRVISELRRETFRSLLAKDMRFFDIWVEHW
jgi:ABC-type multidrug transport system fused ATPase/permease subunit